MATIFSLITVANRLDTAQITVIGHHLNYANAVIRLRYETGALLIKEKDQYRVDLERLIQVPGINWSSKDTGRNTLCR